MTKTEALLEYVSAAGRVCPQPPKWNELLKLLRDRTGTNSRRNLTAPLILAAWWETSDLEKRERLRHHIEWAELHGVLDVADQFLRGLDESQWHYETAQFEPEPARMTQDEAIEHARRHLLSQIQLTPCTIPPDAIYGFDPAKNFLFRLEWPGRSNRVGGSGYVAVSRETGDVRVFQGQED